MVKVDCSFGANGMTQWGGFDPFWCIRLRPKNLKEFAERRQPWHSGSSTLVATTATSEDIIACSFHRDRAKESFNFRVKSAAFSIFMCASSCASTTVFEDGTTQIIGFVNLKIPSTVREKEACSSAIKVSSLGVSIFRVPETTSVSIGHSSNTRTQVKNNCLVLGKPI